MILGLGQKTVYKGNDLHQFHEMREYLRRNKIKYQYKVTDKNNDKTSSQRGTWSGGGRVGGIHGSIGVGSSRDKVYEITISKKDAKQLGL